MKREADCNSLHLVSYEKINEIYLIYTIYQDHDNGVVPHGPMTLEHEIDNFGNIKTLAKSKRIEGKIK